MTYYFGFIMAALIALAAFAIFTAIWTALQIANPRESKGGDLVMYLPSGHRVTLKDYRGSVDFALLKETLQRFEREESQQDADSEAYRTGRRPRPGPKVRLALLPILAASIIVGFLSLLGKPDLPSWLLWLASPTVVITIVFGFFDIARIKKLSQPHTSKHKDK